MKWTLVEAIGFTRAVHEYFGDDEAYRVFQLFPLNHSDFGAVMPGCGGLRKIRWPDRRRGKGTRGGLRIIYLQVPEASRLYLLDVYSKDEAADLTPEEKRSLCLLADLIRKENERPKTRKRRWNA